MTNNYRTIFFLAFAVLFLSVLVAYFFRNSSWTTTSTSTSTTTTQQPQMNQKTVAVIGGGLAGLSAVTEAVRAGAKLILIEKEPKLGGNSQFASSGINAVGTRAQIESNSSDTVENFIQDTLSSGQGESNESLVSILATQSKAAIEFLESFGLKLDALSKCGGHSYARTHRAKPPPGKAQNVGYDIISSLSRYVNQLPPEKLEVLVSHKLTKLLVNSTGGVIGVEVIQQNQSNATPKQILVDAVVLTSGGYAADTEGLLKDYAEDWVKNLPTTNGPWAKGEGIKISREIHARFTDLSRIQVHPTAFVDLAAPTAQKKFLAPEALRGCGGILFNSKGERFVNELGLRDEVTHKVFQHCQPLKLENNQGPVVAYLVLNNAALDLYYAPALAFYRSKGFVRTVENATEFARVYGFDGDTRIRQTIQDYATYYQNSPSPDPFGKTTFPTTFSPDEPLHVMIITPAIHYTMGGLAIDTETHILDETNRPIPSLFGAGEVTGGVHGKNRLAGNSLLECVVFGRIAGKNAASA